MVPEPPVEGSSTELGRPGRLASVMGPGYWRLRPYLSRRGLRRPGELGWYHEAIKPRPFCGGRGLFFLLKEASL
jgi:hypothetical protein